MNMLTNIAMFLVALATIGNSIMIVYMSNKKENSGSLMSNRPLREYTSYETKNRINKLEDKLKDVQPLIDNYEKELNDKAWESYRNWKWPIVTRLDMDGEVCGQCYEDSLEIKTTRKQDFDRELPRFVYEHNDGRPLNAQLKCTECGHVVNQWEFKEDE
ncbi:hypothetical protein [Staphylococcus edaphicus]|uniref:Uncharacterized protein n=2 Tax=Staphylococcus edaphicus TaxID=1955013 RepID=A0A2C6WQW8_9STAP|nr:hypothetical protein [Staphylococcus edaphicus]PHK50779.1 hypothetical protein BTJ66_00300 [Staphylococcus edaphicus]UQW82473.1 hypothetical protein MNY58_05260 [Staphylococcus edaphicus]